MDASILELAGVANEGGFVAVVFWNANVPVNVKYVQRYEYAVINNSVHYFVHLADAVRFFDHHRVELSVVHKEA